MIKFFVAYLIYSLTINEFSDLFSLSLDPRQINEENGDGEKKIDKKTMHFSPGFRYSFVYYLVICVWHVATFLPLLFWPGLLLLSAISLCMSTQNYRASNEP